MEAEEIWNPVQGYEDSYLISNKGNVKSVHRAVPHKRNIFKTCSERILKVSYDRDGYAIVSLSRENVVKTHRIHRLVAQSFIPNPMAYPVVNHKDEDKSNNRSENLEWCSVKYNTNYKGSAYRRSASKRKEIYQYSLRWDFVRKWDHRRDVEEMMSISGGNIVSCCGKKRKTAYGYRWSYATPGEIAAIKERWGE